MTKKDEDEFSKILIREIPDVKFIDAYPLPKPEVIIRPSIAQCYGALTSVCAILNTKITSLDLYEKKYIHKSPSREEYKPDFFGKGLIQFQHSKKANYVPDGLKDGRLAASYDSAEDPETDAFVKAVWKLCKQHGHKLYPITDMKAGTVSPKPHARFIAWPDAIAKFDRVDDMYLTNNTMAYFTSKPG